MKIRVLDNKAIISGYVNVAERISKRLKENGTEFYEKVKEGAFGDAVRRNNNIKILLNHDYQRELGNNELSGWSFGFVPLKEHINETYSDIPLRTVESLNLYEVSILDNNHIPAYNSMSLNVRDVAHEPIEIRSYENLNITIDEPKKELQREVDNSIFIDKIEEFLKERNL